MKIEIWSIGKKNEAIWDAPIQEFIKRINRYYKCTLQIITSKAHSKASVEDTILAESNQILQSLADSDLLICLDERGKAYRTEEFAQQFQAWHSLPYKRMIFLIGGAYGIHADLKDRAYQTIQLSDLTFPHQLVRVILAEQIYRICTVLNNENYHHE